jgi:predicted ATP pyrophosphatase (TIGR00289 family)
MKVAVLFSGGKDSVLALQDSLKKGDEVRYLVSFFSEKPEPYMYNYSNMSFAIMQSLSLGIKLVTRKVEPGKEQEEIKKTLESISKEIDGMVVGVSLSSKQKGLLSKICKPLGIKLLTPLAKKKQDALWKSALDSGFEIIIVYSKGMDRKWLGRTVGKNDMKGLSGKGKAGDSAGFSTLVLNGPIFRSRMEITDSEKKWAGKEGRLMIKDAKLKGAFSQAAQPEAG